MDKLKFKVSSIALYKFLMLIRSNYIDFDIRQIKNPIVS